MNYDIPKNSDDYIHRVGRTARKGKRGLAISIATQYDVQLILNIEKDINEKLQELKVDEEEAFELATKINKAKKIIKIVIHFVSSFDSTFIYNSLNTISKENVRRWIFWEIRPARRRKENVQVASQRSEEGKIIIIKYKTRNWTLITS